MRALALAVALLASAGGAAAPTATATASVSSAAIGDDVDVTGSGWPKGTLVTVEVCGNEANDATVDCDLASSRQVGVRDDGGVSIRLTLAAPPISCPCVIRLSSGTTEVLVPIDIAGVGEAEPTTTSPPAISRSVRIDKVKLGPERGLAGWFGGTVHRTLEVHITNEGDAAVPSPLLSVVVGRRRPLTEVQPSPDLAALQPGASVKVTVPVEIDGPTFGKYAIEASVEGVGDPPVARTTVTTFPWGAIVLAVVVAQIGLVVVRNQLRDKLAPEEGESEDEVEAPAG